jgi:hypothetical protein
MGETPQLLLPFLWDFLALFFAFWATVAVLFGSMLLTSPARFEKLSTYFNGWRSGRRALRPVELPIRIEPLVYRHHRLVGTVIALGGLYTIALLWAVEFPFASGSAIDAIAGDAIKMLLMIGNAVGIAVGLTVAIRPSALKKVEAYATAWVSTRQVARPLETMNFTVDRHTALHPRRVGLLLIVAGVYLLLLTTSMPG